MSDQYCVLLFNLQGDLAALFIVVEAIAESRRGGKDWSFLSIVNLRQWLSILWDKIGFNKQYQIFQDGDVSFLERIVAIFVVLISICAFILILLTLLPILILVIFMYFSGHVFSLVKFKGFYLIIYLLIYSSYKMGCVYAPMFSGLKTINQ